MFAGIERIGVVKSLAIQSKPAEQRVVHRLFEQIGVARVVVGQSHLPLKENYAAAGARFTVRIISQRVIWSEAFGGFAAPDASGHVVLAIDDVVPERFNGAAIVRIVRLSDDIGHAGVAVHGSHGVTDCFVLFDHGQVALIVFALLSLAARTVIAI